MVLFTIGIKTKNSSMFIYIYVHKPSLYKLCINWMKKTQPIIEQPMHTEEKQSPKTEIT